MNGYAEAFFPSAPSYPIVDRLTDGSAVVDLRQMAPLRLFAAQTHQQAPRCPRSVNGVRTFALPLASAPCSLISRSLAASSSSSVPHGYRLNFAVPVLASDHAIPLSLPPDHGRRNLPLPCFSRGAHRPLRPPFTASSGQLSCRLPRSLPSILLPAQSRCTRRPAKLACSPSSPFACSALPLQHTQRLPSPPCASFAVPDKRQPLSPLQPSFSLRLSRPSPDPWPRQLPSALVHDPRPLIRAAHFPVTHAESPFIRSARPRLDLSPSS